jgi:SH3-like domain-containing protein
MTTLSYNRRLFHAVMYFVIACVIAAALLGCSPYQVVPNSTTRTPTAAPSVTATMTPAGVKSPTPSPIVCTVTAYTLNMRQAGRMTAAVIQILENGDTLRVIRHAGNWIQVRTPQRVTGWVYGRYCR